MHFICLLSKVKIIKELKMSRQYDIDYKNEYCQSSGITPTANAGRAEGNVTASPGIRG